MLAMADKPIGDFLPFFANSGVNVAFLVPTPTGYEKSIMDATGSVRELLLEERVHDYGQQGQGPENKHIVQAFFVNENGLTETTASLYRPVTKQGDPRIWFAGLKKYCAPCNLLALIVIRGSIYVINLSSDLISYSLSQHGYVYDILAEANYQDNSIAIELLSRIQKIHNRGFLRSITPGDPGVGDTLEHALGISRNNNKAPDYHGIELKASRLTRAGRARPMTRQTIFSRVPDKGMSYHEILDAYGKVQMARNHSEPRLQLYETFRCSRANAYGLQLDVPNDQSTVDILYIPQKRYVSSWTMELLKEALLLKHRETFWVKATAIVEDGIEMFRYDRVLHTHNPNPALLPPLFETDKITVDLAAHKDLKTNHYRDHGVLFKMQPNDLPLLFGDPIVYDLTKGNETGHP